MTSSTATDPHAYLEDAADPRTIAWTVAQNELTRAALDAAPGRALLTAQLETLLAVDVQGVPVVRAGRAFFTARRGRADQASLYVREAGPERVLLDPATFDAAGLVTIDWWYASPSGALVAFGLSRNGDERSTLHVLDVATGRRLTRRSPIRVIVVSHGIPTSAVSTTRAIHRAASTTYGSTGIRLEMLAKATSPFSARGANLRICSPLNFPQVDVTSSSTRTTAGRAATPTLRIPA